jgi:hypothetical protein
VKPHALKPSLQRLVDNDLISGLKQAVGYYPSGVSPDYILVALYDSHANAVAAAEMYADKHRKFRWFVKTL